MNDSAEPPPRWTVPAVALLVLATAVVVFAVLWRWIDTLALADGEKKAAAQLDAVKDAASIAVGGGGLFALYLAARRQRTQELELDARHTELHHREAELTQRDRVQAHTEQVAEANRQHVEQVAAANQRDAADRQITELYATAVEQLGSAKASVLSFRVCALIGSGALSVVARWVPGGAGGFWGCHDRLWLRWRSWSARCSRGFRRCRSRMSRTLAM